MPDRYLVRTGYRSRANPAYDNDRDSGTVWQPDVYQIAARIAKSLGAGRIIDIGCGRGAKLVEYHPRFKLTGLDFSSNIAHCRASYPFATWIDHDLEQTNDLPLSAADLEEAVIVCADVVELLLAPERLLAALVRALDGARALLISTPERELTNGTRHDGPPRNSCHVREWSVREFQALLTSSGLIYQSLGLTRSNDLTDQAHTILAVLAPNQQVLDEIVPIVIDLEPSAPQHSVGRTRLLRAIRALTRS